MPRKRLRYLCHASHHGRRIAGPPPDPNEVERQAWEYLRAHVDRYYDEARRAGMKAEREVSEIVSIRPRPPCAGAVSWEDCRSA
jgi:hypothetical protein